MALLSEIIFNIKNLRKNGRVSDDDSISDRQWAFIINYYRAKLVKQEQQKKKAISGNIVQNLGKVTLIKADKNECCEIGDCILRIENPLPTAIDTDAQPLITYVGLLNGSRSFQRTTYERAIWDAHAKYTGKEPKWYQQGNYIYIVNPPTKNLKYINVQGVFEDPTKAITYRTCDCEENGETCFEGFDYEYPLAVDKIDTVIKMIAEAELRITLQHGGLDTSNNTSDDKN
jgi:hypothetical protein